MSYPVIKYKNPSNNEYNFLYDVLKKNGSTVSKKSLTQYFLSNNTSVVFPVLNNQIKNPRSNLKVYDYYLNRLNNYSQIEQEDLWLQKIKENIKNHKKNEKNAIFLSGGTDSILIACILKELYGKDNLIAITVDYKTDFHLDEVNRAKTVAKNLGIKHYIIDQKPIAEDYVEIINQQAHCVDLSSPLLAKGAKKILDHFGDNKVDVFNGEFNLMEIGVSEDSDPTRNIRRYIFRNNKKLSFLKIFELFEYGKLKSGYLINSKNKYLMTFNDIIRFLFEKKTDLEWTTGYLNGKSKFPGYHGTDIIDNINYKEFFLNFYANLNLRSLDDIKEFLYSVVPLNASGMINLELMTNITSYHGMNMIHPFCSDELYAIGVLTKYDKDKILQKKVIDRKYKIDKDVIYFVKNHQKFNDYFASTFDQDSFKSFFNQTGYFDKLLNFLPSSTVPLKELKSMKTNGPSNQRQFRIFILAQVLNTFKVE